MNVFQYKGYTGSAEVDTDSFVLVGKLLFIRDVITYSADDAKGLEAAFQEAVDEYLASCADLGDEPDTPFKGSFNVRVGTERHRRVAMKARSQNVGLNEFVCQAIDVACGAKTEHHTHVEVRLVSERSAQIVATAGQTPRWETARAIH